MLSVQGRSFSCHLGLPVLRPTSRTLGDFKVGYKSLRNSEASLHEVPLKLTPEDEGSTVLSSGLGLFLQFSGWRRAHSGAH